MNLFGLKNMGSTLRKIRSIQSRKYVRSWRGRVSEYIKQKERVELINRRTMSATRLTSIGAFMRAVFNIVIVSIHSIIYLNLHSLGNSKNIGTAIIVDPSIKIG